MRPIALAAAGLMLCSGIAFSQEKSADCGNASTPAKLEGQVVKVDSAQGKLTVRGSDGTMHEFKLAKEVLQQYKAGDSINAKLRC